MLKYARSENPNIHSNSGRPYDFNKPSFINNPSVMSRIELDMKYSVDAYIDKPTAMSIARVSRNLKLSGFFNLCTFLE